MSLSDLDDLVHLGTHPELAKRQMQIWMPRDVTYASRVVPAAQAIDVPNGSTVILASAQLLVGQWSISGEVWFNITNGSPSIQQLAGAIAPTGAALPTDVDVSSGLHLIEVNQSRSAGSMAGFVLPIAQMFIPVSQPVTYYLIAYATWTGSGSIAAYGKMAGRMFTTPAWITT